MSTTEAGAELERISNLIYAALLQTDTDAYHQKSVNLRHRALTVALDVLHGEA